MLRTFLNWVNQLWIIGRNSKLHYIRFYPNPGFMLTIKALGIQIKWSWHHGWKTKKVN